MCSPMCYTAMLDKKILEMIGFCYEVYICRRPPDLGVSKAALSLPNTAIPALYLKTKCDNENFNGLVRFAVLWWTQRDSSLGDREVWMIASALYDNVKLTIKVHCTFGNGNCNDHGESRGNKKTACNLHDRSLYIEWGSRKLCRTLLKKTNQVLAEARH